MQDNHQWVLSEENGLRLTKALGQILIANNLVLGYFMAMPILALVRAFAISSHFLLPLLVLVSPLLLVMPLAIILCACAGDAFRCVPENSGVQARANFNFWVGVLTAVCLLWSETRLLLPIIQAFSLIYLLAGMATWLGRADLTKHLNFLLPAPLLGLAYLLPLGQGLGAGGHSLHSKAIGVWAFGPGVTQFCLAGLLALLFLAASWRLRKAVISLRSQLQDTIVKEALANKNSVSLEEEWTS